ncbi:hypothetical protein IQ272_02575 [Chroococcidiopsidales cyanobacterium LEGE 13417]|nr:hypothetical protein [Chroococcidiopsidales cyanobacterium LEGE 13417]
MRRQVGIRNSEFGIRKPEVFDALPITSLTPFYEYFLGLFLKGDEV